MAVVRERGNQVEEEGGEIQEVAKTKVEGRGVEKDGGKEREGKNRRLEMIIKENQPEISLTTPACKKKGKWRKIGRAMKKKGQKPKRKKKK